MAKLPVWETVRQSYGFVRANLPAMGLLAQRWAIAALIAFGLSWLLVRQALQAETDAGVDLPSMGERVAAMTSLSVLIGGIAVYVIVVRWHRIIIQGSTAAETKRSALSAGFLYLARGLLLGVIGAMIAVAGLLPTTLLRSVGLPEDVKRALLALFLAGAVAAAFLVVGRLSLVLPAGAVGDLAMTLRRSWVVTRGHSWRILAGSLLASGPAIAVNLAFNGLLERTTGGPNDAIALTVGIALSLVLTVIAAVIQASFLSYAYLHLARRDEDQIHAPPALER